LPLLLIVLPTLLKMIGQDEKEYKAEAAQVKSDALEQKKDEEGKW